MSFQSFGKTEIMIAAALALSVLVVMVFSAALKWNRERTKKKRNALIRNAAVFLFACILLLSALSLSQPAPQTEYAFDLDAVEAYTDSPYTEINDNVPFFTEAEKKLSSFTQFSELDSLGRCGAAMALIDKTMMPKEERGEIDSVKPSGYHNAVYEDLIEDGFLYNRCHLIGFQMSGENANEKNLITGTRYMNVEGMEPFENETAYYLRRTGNHVLYRITPVFAGNELVCRGVLMEAYSVEDKGKGISYCIFCYNVQPGIEIDYATGESRRAE